MKLSSWKYISIHVFNYKGGDGGGEVKTRVVGAGSSSKKESKVIEVKKRESVSGISSAI